MEWLIEVEALKAILGETLSSQVAQFGIAFAIAAWLHSGRVKKEIIAQSAHLVSAMQEIARTLRLDLEAQQETTRLLSKRMDKIEEQINTQGGEDGSDQQTTRS